MSIASRLNTIKKSVPEHVTLVAVSKTKPTSDILEAYHAGQRIFGENKIQDMAAKYEELPKDIEWHMIGHVQTNKVKHMASFVSLVHGVDSLKLLDEINRQAKKHNRVIDCLLQLHVAEEETKFGMDKNELSELLHSSEFKALENIKVSGLMGMATFTENQQQIKKEFDYLKSVFDRFSTENPEFKILSMGMSDDYDLAIECGSTMVRIGSSIFGERNYN
jgi:pyridoxal phosphate enzyme (YggS family)